MEYKYISDCWRKCSCCKSDVLIIEILQHKYNICKHTLPGDLELVDLLYLTKEKDNEFISLLLEFYLSYDRSIFPILYDKCLDLNKIELSQGLYLCYRQGRPLNDVRSTFFKDNMFSKYNILKWDTWEKLNNKNELTVELLYTLLGNKFKSLL